MKKKEVSNEEHFKHHHHTSVNMAEDIPAQLVTKPRRL